QVVGVLMERQPAMVVAIWGILKAGGAYLPLAPGYPPARINYMIRDSSLGLILTRDGLPEGVVFDGQLVDPDGAALDGQPAGAPGVAYAPSDLAYVIYTSGTTGNPKGVMIEHYALLNRLHWMQSRYALDAADVVLLKTPYTFDVSVWELFWWSLSGASLCILPEGQEKEPQCILEHIDRYRVSVLHFVPSMLSSMLDYLPGNVGPEALRTLRQVFASGEALRPDVVSKFNQVINGHSRRIALTNLYGPTEATIDVSYYDCRLGAGEERLIPIGRPIANTQLLILNGDYQLQPVGAVGELCIGGKGLARGYMNRPELTQEKFKASRLVEGGRVYCTGDRARWSADGEIEYLGRVDHQVKIRGHRIELGEIEHWLSGLDSVRECAVVDYEAGEHKLLCAYLVGSAEIDEKALRAYAARQLPPYMIPTHWMAVEELPKTAHGKLDRKRLPYPVGRVPAASQPSRNETERELAALWQQLLNVEAGDIDIDADFFGMGGQSLKAIALVSLIHREFDVKLPVAEIFRRPTVRELAQRIREARKTAYAAIPVAAVQADYALSAAQRRMYVLQQMEPASTAYNMARVVLLEGPLQHHKLQAAFGQLVERHQ
ncbi:MAG: amino acid adenylation domain-containing protein, partial [Cytophagales bacterium]|nr:amino acid adenylation domain-containing protein [Cytophagales bacterium]